MTNDRITVGLLLFPDMTQLDMTGPYEVFASMPRTTYAPTSSPDSARVGATRSVGDGASGPP